MNLRCSRDFHHVLNQNLLGIHFNVEVCASDLGVVIRIGDIQGVARGGLYVKYLAGLCKLRTVGGFFAGQSPCQFVVAGGHHEVAVGIGTARIYELSAAVGYGHGVVGKDFVDYCIVVHTRHDIGDFADYGLAFHRTCRDFKRLAAFEPAAFKRSRHAVAGPCLDGIAAVEQLDTVGRQIVYAYITAYKTFFVRNPYHAAFTEFFGFGIGTRSIAHLGVDSGRKHQTALTLGSKALLRATAGHYRGRNGCCQ